jgi:hypothetical protein
MPRLKWKVERTKDKAKRKEETAKGGASDF